MFRAEPFGSRVLVRWRGAIRHPPLRENFIPNVGRKLAFVLAASNHGTMIINRFDYRMTGPNPGVGVGYQLLEAGSSTRWTSSWRCNYLKRGGAFMGMALWRSMAAPISEPIPSNGRPR